MAGRNGAAVKTDPRGTWIRVAIPTLMSLLLFFVAIFFVELPNFRDGLIEQKKGGIRNVVQLGIDIVNRQYKLETAGIISREEAQKRALALLATMRYGPQGKAYYWVNDMDGVMLMHPYRRDLENKNVLDLEDITGKKFIGEFVEAVSEKGGSFVSYYWQWQDQPGRIEQKISYVQGFEPWGWIVGSGLYLDDVEREMQQFLRKQLWTLLGITLIILLLGGLSIWQGVRADRDMARTAGMFRAIFNQTYQFIGLLRVDGRLLRANQSALGFLGIMPREVVGKPFWETAWWNHSPEQMQQCRDAISRAALGEIVRGEARHKNFLGELRVIDYSLKPVRDEGGHIIYLLAEGRDVTDWKTAELALRASERYSRMLFEQAAVGLGVVDADGRFTDVNQTFADILRGRAEHISGTMLSDWLPGGTRERDQLMQAESMDPVEKWMLRQDGNVVPVRIASIRFETTGQERFMFSVEDITDLKQAEEELRLSEEKYRDLVQDAQSVILRWRTDGTILFANEFAQKLFGYSEEELVGHEMQSTIMPESDMEESMAELTKTIAMTPDNYHSTEMWNLRKDGQKLWMAWTSKPLFDSNGNLTEILSVGLDSTERREAQDELRALNEELEQRVEARTNELKESLESLKKAQEQLVESEKMASLGGLVAGVAHEINTPIGVGVTTISYLQQKADEMDRVYKDGRLKRSDFEKFIKLSMESSSAVLLNLSRASELIQSFKQVAVDQTSEERRTFELKQYIDEVLLSLRSKYKRTKHEISVSGPEVELDSYPGAVMQVLTNLLMNSLTHGLDGIEAGHIAISTELQGDSVVIKYSDDGNGMDEETRARIFEPFYTTKRGQGGTGLGMHMVYNLVIQRLQGTISCQSSPGNGATFRIVIPLGPKGGKASE